MENFNVEPLQVTVWDESAALKRVREKPERLVSLTKRFLDVIGSDLDELHRAVLDEDFVTARRAAHTIKGVAANMCAEELRREAFELELAAENNSAQVLKEKLPALDAALAELNRALEAFLTRQA